MGHAVAIARLSGTLVLVCAAAQAFAGQLNGANECAVGMRVSTSDGHKGAVTRVDKAWSYCYVKQDDTGKEVGYLYSLLRSEGAAPAKGSAPVKGTAPPKGGGAGPLVIGVYTCWVGSEPSAAGLAITGASTYESDGQKGYYRVDAGGTIVFETGPYTEYHAHVLDGRRIGMNLDNGRFYNLTCDPPK